MANDTPHAESDWAVAQRRALVTLEGRLRDLEALQVTSSEDPQADDEWSLTSEILNWLHTLDEAAAHKYGKKRYYEQIRPSSTGGQTQAALTFIRGIVHHHAAAIQTTWLQPVTRMFRVMEDGSLARITKTQVVTETGLVPVLRFARVRRAWQTLAELPPSTQPAHGRGLYYEQHVARKDLLPSLRAAQSFLEELASQQP